jgi:hypothetical protein
VCVCPCVRVSVCPCVRVSMCVGVCVYKLLRDVAIFHLRVE